jgi:dihydroorotate dehydrogenase
VFRGLGLVGEIKTALLAALARDSGQNIADYVGADAAAVTAEPWPA